MAKEKRRKGAITSPEDGPMQMTAAQKFKAEMSACIIGCGFLGSLGVICSFLPNGDPAHWFVENAEWLVGCLLFACILFVLYNISPIASGVITYLISLAGIFGFFTEYKTGGMGPVEKRLFMSLLIVFVAWNGMLADWFSAKTINKTDTFAQKSKKKSREKEEESQLSWLMGRASMLITAHIIISLAICFLLVISWFLDESLIVSYQNDYVEIKQESFIKVSIAAVVLAVILLKALRLMYPQMSIIVLCFIVSFIGIVVPPLQCVFVPFDNLPPLVAAASATSMVYSGMALFQAIIWSIIIARELKKKGEKNTQTKKRYKT